MNVLRSRLVLALLFCLACVGSAAAQGKNGYGKKGRTIVSGGVGGFRSNVSRADWFDHDATASGWGRLTLLHFWIDNLAVGGTVQAGGERLDDDFDERSRSRYAGGDVDVVGHVPLNPRLSLRLWAWAGLRWSRSHVGDDGDEGVTFRTGSALAVDSGASLEMLVHLSPSVALGLGPTFGLRKQLRAGRSLQATFTAGPTMTYSFGPDEAEKRVDDARRFGARGRRLLGVYGSFDGDGISSRASYARFVRQGVALGGYVGAGTNGRAFGHLAHFRAGVEAWFDLPIARYASVLLQPSVGWGWRRAVFNEATSQSEQVHEDLVHQFELSLGAYACMHLFDGLVIGVGPYVRSDLQLDPYDAHRRYLQGGVASLIAASF